MPSRRSPTLPTLDRTARAIAVLTLVGFVLRLAWAWFATRTPAGIHDPFFYVAYGDRIARGLGYTTPEGHAAAYYPVGYPAVLSVVFWFAHRLPGDHLLGAAIALNVATGTATIAAMAIATRRLLGDRAAIGTALVVALLPGFVFPTALVLTETVFDFVIALLLLVLCWRPWRQRWSSGRTVAAGALVGVACLIRPPALVLVPIIVVLWLLAERRSAAAAVRRSVILVGVALLVLAPWFARNWAATGRPTLAASTGDNLCIGNNPDATGAFNLSPYCFDGLTPELFITGTDGRDAELTDRAITWAKDHVADEPALVWWRTWYTLEDDHEAVFAVESYGDDRWLQPSDADRLSTLADDAYYLVLALAVAGSVFMLRRVERDERTMLVLAVATGFVVVVWPFFGDTRFHLPTVLALTVPAGAALATIANLAQRRRG